MAELGGGRGDGGALLAQRLLQLCCNLSRSPAAVSTLPLAVCDHRLRCGYTQCIPPCGPLRSHGTAHCAQSLHRLRGRYPTPPTPFPAVPDTPRPCGGMQVAHALRPDDVVDVVRDGDPDWMARPAALDQLVCARLLCFSCVLCVCADGHVASGRWRSGRWPWPTGPSQG